MSLRVLHLTQRYLPAQGGAEQYLAKICRHLTHTGHKVTVATSNAHRFEQFWQPTLPAIPKLKEQLDGVQVLRFPVTHLPAMPRSYHAVRRLIWLGSHAHAPLFILQRLAMLTPKMPALWHWVHTTSQKFDLVVGLNIAYENFLLAGHTLAHRQQIPFITIPFTHLGAGITPGQDTISRFYTMRHQRHLVVNSDHLVAQSPTEQKFYVSHGIAPAQTSIIEPGIHPATVTGGDGVAWREKHQIQSPIVFAIGTLSSDKGTTYLVEAVAKLWAEGQELSLVLAGQMIAEFEAYVEKMPASIRHRIHFLGRISDQEKRDLLAAGDIFAMPSRADSFGIVYLEAWLNGKPVIAAKSWGVTDLVSHGVDGLVVEYGNVVALADTISHLVDHPTLAHALGQQGNKKALTHTWDTKLDKIQTLYQRLATPAGEKFGI